MAKSTKKKSKSSFLNKNNSYQKQLKIFSILLFIISFFLLVALISYSYEDESTIQMESSEVIGLVTGDEIAQIKAESVENWLGLIGAYISYFIYNKTFGFVAIFLPLVMFRWAYDLLKHSSITKANIR